MTIQTAEDGEMTHHEFLFKYGFLFFYSLNGLRRLEERQDKMVVVDIETEEVLRTMDKKRFKITMKLLDMKNDN